MIKINFKKMDLKVIFKITSKGNDYIYCVATMAIIINVK